MSALPEAPTNLPAFQRMFGTEDACRDYLFRVRWPDGFACPKCGSRTAWPREDRDLMECNNGHMTSVTAGTVMHGTRTPLCTWFHAAYLVSSLTPGISALQFQRQLGIKRYETAYQMLHKLRSSMVAPDREKLSTKDKGTLGHVDHIEIDEAFVGGPEEGRPGRGAETKALVIVAVEVIRWFDTSGRKGQQGHERGTLPYGPPIEDEYDGEKGVWRTRAGRVRLSVIPDASAEVLLPWVERNVEPGSKIHTDGWSGYTGLERMGYTHSKVLQSSQGKKTGRYLPMVHLIISNLKRWLIGTHKGAVLPKHLPAYLNEFTFRFNRRFWRGPAFLRALGLATHVKDWPEYKTLYASGKEGGWAHPNPKLAHVRPELVEGIIDGMWHLAPSDELRRWIEDHRPEIAATLKTSLERAPS
jgi:transposase-like protein